MLNKKNRFDSTRKKRKIVTRSSSFRKNFSSQTNKSDVRKRYTYEQLENIISVFCALLLFILCILVVLSSISKALEDPQESSIPETAKHYSSAEQMRINALEAAKEATSEPDSSHVNAKPEPPKRTITCWGDSFGLSANANVTPFSITLASLSKRTTYNVSVPDDNIHMIAARQGGLAMYTEPFFIPSDIQSVEIKLINDSGIILEPHFNYNGGLNPCIIAGIEGIVSEIDEKLYFTRSANGPEKIITERTRVTTRAMQYRLSDISVFFVGSDAIFSDPNKTLEIYQSMIDTLDQENLQFLIVGPVMGKREVLDNLDSVMSQAFGDRYLSIRQFLISEDTIEKYDLFISESAQLSIDKGLLPNSYFESNFSSFTTEMNYIIAELVNERLESLGAFTN